MSDKMQRMRPILSLHLVGGTKEKPQKMKDIVGVVSKFHVNERKF
jgi:hypothetical protein